MITPGFSSDGPSRSAALLAIALLLLTSTAFRQAAPPSATSTVALVGGRVLDGYGGAPIENGVVLIAGERIVAVGPSHAVDVPADAEVIDTQGMTVLPGLFDMHVHLNLLGHGDYLRWDELYQDRSAELVMPIAARCRVP